MSRLALHRFNCSIRVLSLTQLYMERTKFDCAADMHPLRTLHFFAQHCITPSAAALSFPLSCVELFQVASSHQVGEDIVVSSAVLSRGHHLQFAEGDTEWVRFTPNNTENIKSSRTQIWQRLWISEKLTESERVREEKRRDFKVIFASARGERVSTFVRLGAFAWDAHVVGTNCDDSACSFPLTSTCKIRSGLRQTSFSPFAAASALQCCRFLLRLSQLRTRLN